MIEPNRAAILSFIQPLPIRRVPGIGKVMGRMLQGLGIIRCGQLEEAKEILFQLFPPATCKWFASIWLGTISSTKRGRVKKSVSRERTFHEFFTAKELHEQCCELCGSVSSELLRLQMATKLVMVRMKNRDFEIFTASTALERGVHTKEELVQVASRMLDNLLATLPPPQGPLDVRMVGVCASSLAAITNVVAGATAVATATPSTTDTCATTATDDSTPFSNTPDDSLGSLGDTSDDIAFPENE
eukprot:TRINITY_DN351_c0_g3_i3.p1 TRINITY_DN351_c0_g3~~TRINITY_DN351_c0_g3_i3.p1  ORF type:complete len:244 (+),score=51.58 TRINITY_DN351_c0_g3_i3:624-1355(+)